MQSFDEINFSDFLPAHLKGESKEQLKNSLKQFHVSETVEKINYSNFYTESFFEFFFQGDLIPEVRFPHFNPQNFSFEKAYTNAVIISNTCDISSENNRTLNNKECLLAPIIELDGYTEQLKQLGRTPEQIQSHKQEIYMQKISNLFFFPQKNNWEKGYIAYLDKMFWFPTNELNSFNIKEDRISCLNQFGFYLFVLKISYHLCRLPEQNERG